MRDYLDLDKVYKKRAQKVLREKRRYNSNDFIESQFRVSRPSRAQPKPKAPGKGKKKGAGGAKKEGGQSEAPDAGIVDRLLLTEFEQSLVSGMHDLVNKEGEFVHANYKRRD